MAYHLYMLIVAVNFWERLDPEKGFYVTSDVRLNMWIFPPHTHNSQCRLWIQLNPVQDEVLTEDK